MEITEEKLRRIFVEFSKDIRKEYYREGLHTEERYEEIDQEIGAKLCVLIQYLAAEAMEYRERDK